GKTNILDALHYLSMTKSSINPVDSTNIKFEENQFMIKSKVHVKKKTRLINCAASLGKKKEIKVDRKEHEKLSHHIGMFPLVMISPNDTDLIYDSNDVRRKFFDSAISQSNKKYLQHLITYTFALKNRNALLKMDTNKAPMDYDLLRTYTQLLIEHGKPIYEERLKYVNRFLVLFNKHYESLHSKIEPVSIQYESQFEDKAIEILYEKSLQKDLITQRTSIGTHKDSFLFTIYGKPLKRHGSQGQQKSFLVGLKLAQFELLSAQQNLKPTLLLDDIFDKLDDERMHKLLQKVTANEYGQLFITDARPERTLKVLEANKLSARIFEVENGAIINTSDYEA
ncbi:DNA recombination and repair protein RecF, partial [hydrothermal vent metagenome]